MVESVEKRRVLLGVSGSIAAFKAAEIGRLLISRGYQVQVVMTEAGARFISPLTMEGITGNPVVTDFFDGSEIEGIGHIELADWAGCFLIAPASADVISKLANGLADCPISTVALATRAPVLVAPAMNVNMLEHPATQSNLATLKSRGVRIIEPEIGSLACGWQGSGRLADPWNIFHHVRRALSTNDLSGKRILITAGPTREALDPVRFISNRSSGKMGIALVREAYRRGADVRLIHGPISVKVPSEVQCFPINSAEELDRELCSFIFEKKDSWQPDVVIMTAAVSDFRPKSMASAKIKKGEFPTKIEIVQNTDILGKIGAERYDGIPVLIGFAVETGTEEDLVEYARAKLNKKQCDVVVANLADDAFDKETNRVWIIDKHGGQSEVATSYKSRVANKILDCIRKF